MNFKKQDFIAQVERILHAEYATDIKSATKKELYNAVSKSVMLETYTDWKASTNNAKKRGAYFSAEFLVGRSIFSNLLNIGILDDVKEVLAEKGIDINEFEEVEDAALGNGGLGRLAACYLDSAAAIGMPLDGYGIRYRYGLFRQTFVDGFQHEEGDCWLKWGDPWSTRIERDAKIVTFSDQKVLAVPYDMPVFGYHNDVINTLRLWQSEPIKEFDFTSFNEMRGEQIATENFKATKITDVLYPNDNTLVGKMLRLRQQYFLVSASLQDILAKFKAKGKSWQELPDYVVIQLNDTHPVLAIPELLRLLSNEGLSFEEGFNICHRVFNFTNHTIMSEALEKWDEMAVRELLPDVWQQIALCQYRLEAEGVDRNMYYIMKDGRIHMANLAIYVASRVNGVAEIHTGILKRETFHNWYCLFPDKFVNITNGITPRRWFLLNNPEMAKAVTAKIGTEWQKDLTKLKDLLPYCEDKEFIAQFKQIKRANKEKLAAYIKEHEGIELNPDFVFDVQVKRLHEYKRQLLNALSILYFYYEIKEGRMPDFTPTAFIFGAKAAPGYYNAKAIIKFINEIAKLVNQDPEMNDKMKVVFVQNYNVSYAEKIVCAADISEQISMAGMEASGTGNMKFMLNGTVTLGTMDGANVEICEEAGVENNYIFGATVDQVPQIKNGYNPFYYLDRTMGLRRVVESLVNGTFRDAGTNNLKSVFDSLLYTHNPDNYLVLADFEDYVRVKKQLLADYGTDAFFSKCLKNLACSGKFSSDRSVRDYGDLIWHI